LGIKVRFNIVERERVFSFARLEDVSADVPFYVGWGRQDKPYQNDGQNQQKSSRNFTDCFLFYAFSLFSHSEKPKAIGYLKIDFISHKVRMGLKNLQ
jgi:hypothetical protein